jgi:hypothetical protein
MCAINHRPWFAFLFIVVGIALGTIGGDVWQSLQQLPQGFNSVPIGVLRWRKDVAEDFASIAKASQNPSRGRDLYRAAMTANNRLIATMVVALGESDDEHHRKGLGMLRKSADETWGEFRDFVSRPAVAGARPGVAGSSAQNPIGVLVDLMQLYEGQGQAQRDTVRRLLDQCYWRQWSDI